MKAENKLALVLFLIAVLLIAFKASGEVTSPGGDVASETAARIAADLLKVDITDGTATNLTVPSINYTGASAGTNYVASLAWDATNKVFIVVETAE